MPDDDAFTVDPSENPGFPFQSGAGADPGFKPWEQRPAPGMGSGGYGSEGGPPPVEAPERLIQTLDREHMRLVIDDQSRLAHYPQITRFASSQGDQEQTVDENGDVWRLFAGEHLYDTRRVRLERFHLFEWFPLAPGLFYAPAAEKSRREAFGMIEQTPQGAFFTPEGKMRMLAGGVGAVRLRPRLVSGEPHYFMTASSNGVCHEGFPMLVPRRYYSQLKPHILADGAAPVTLSGEMRYLYEDLPAFFEGRRDIPQLYLFVDELEILSGPRPGVSAYLVSAPVSFAGKVRDREGMYFSYASFDPASRDELARAIRWLETFYVTGQFKGVVVTDFDEVQPRFSGAIFGLPDLMAGKLNQAQVKQFLRDQGFSEEAGERFFLIYQEINTQGGAYIEGNVDTGGGDFITGP